MAVKVGTFTAQTSTGTQAIAGVGFEPELIIFYGTNRTSAGNAAGDFSISYGFCTIDETACISYAGEDDSAAASGAHRGDRAIHLIDEDGTIIGSASLSTTDVDGFTLNWNTAAAGGYQINYMALAGQDMTNIKIGQFQTPGSTGSNAVTGVGFEPDFVLLIYNNETSFPNTSGTSFASMHLSMYDGTNARWIGAKKVNSILDTMHSGSGGSTDQNGFALLRSTDPDAGSFDTRGDWTSLDSDGFTLTFDAVNPQNYFSYLAIKGGSWSVGTDDVPASTTSQAITAPGFEPEGVAFFATTPIETDDDTTSTDQALAVFATDGTNHAGILNTGDYSAADTGVGHNVTSPLTMLNEEDPTSAVEVSALTSLDATGFTLNWTTVSGNEPQFAYFAAAVGDAVEADFSWQIIFSDNISLSLGS